MLSLEDELRADAFFDDPYATYRRLRDEAPAYRSEAWNGWLVSRHDDVKRVLDEPATFSSADRMRRRLEALPPEAWRELERVYGGFRGFFWSDPPEYTELRARMTHAFRPRLAALEARVRAILDELVGAARERGRLDVVADLALPLPAAVVFELLGVPQGARPRFRGWCDRVIALANLPDASAVADVAASMDEACAWARGLVEERRARPRDDMLSELVADVDPDRLPDADLRTLVVTLIQLLLAGHETTTALIANGVHALLAHPRELDLLRRRPDALDAAVEELLRYESPLQYVTRRATREVELHGRRIEADEIVLVLLGSANRDERRFARPDELDVLRRPNRHLAFGFNVHFCLGAPLARLEARLALRALLDLPELRLADGEQPRFRRNAMFRRLESLVVATA